MRVSAKAAATQPSCPAASAAARIGRGSPAAPESSVICPAARRTARVTTAWASLRAMRAHQRWCSRVIAKAPERLAEPLLARRIKSRRGFVEQQQAGSASSARAIASRCRMPRENLRTRSSAAPRQPRRLERRGGAFCGRSRPYSFANSSRFSSAVSSSYRRIWCATSPMRALDGETISCPPRRHVAAAVDAGRSMRAPSSLASVPRHWEKRHRPARDGRTSNAAIFSNVDLPEPLAPTSATHSPGAI